MADIMKPIISISGTSRKELIDQRIEAGRALMALMKTMSNMVPNGRDYIGQPLAFERDRSIHRARFAILDAMHNELMDEALHIRDWV